MAALWTLSGCLSYPKYVGRKDEPNFGTIIRIARTESLMIDIA